VKKAVVDRLIRNRGNYDALQLEAALSRNVENRLKFLKFEDDFQNLISYFLFKDTAKFS